MTMDNDSVTPTSTIVDDISVPPVTVTWAAETELALISVEGPEAVKFLQGQVTCDVEELARGVTRLGAQCNPKGRMLISFRALQAAPERILLRMHRGLIESALLSLGKYIVFSKAKLFDRSSDYRPIIIHGPEAGVLVKRIWGSAPQANNEWQEVEGNFIIRIDECSFECWLTAGAAADNWSELAGAMVTTGANTATLFAIRQGLGEVRPDTRELFTPQGLNYQLVNGISFRKGCYTGQEIVARLHYRATLKRHMYRVEFPLDSGDRLPQPGSPVVTQAQQTIGEIVMAAYAGPEFAEALAIIADEHLAHAVLPGSPVKKLSPLPLPYAIPTEDNN